jgi:hypothetical protein
MICFTTIGKHARGRTRKPEKKLQDKASSSNCSGKNPNGETGYDDLLHPEP